MLNNDKSVLYFHIYVLNYLKRNHAVSRSSHSKFGVVQYLFYINVTILFYSVILLVTLTNLSNKVNITQKGEIIIYHMVLSASSQKKIVLELFIKFSRHVNNIIYYVHIEDSSRVIY